MPVTMRLAVLLALIGCGTSNAPLASETNADAAPPEAGVAQGAPDASAADAAPVAIDATPDARVRCVLTDSPPVVVTKDGAVVENLRVTADGKPGITITNASNVVVRNVEVHHTGTTGIALDGANGARLENVVVTHDGAPAAGPNPSSDLDNITIQSSSGVTVDGARLTRGSTGIYLLSSPKSVLRNIEGHDFRGPFPRGQLVQWDKSDDALLEIFSVVNPSDTAWTEDDVNVYQSLRATVRLGLVDGNNSPNGVGVIFDGDTSTGVVEDVDAVHMGNGCFSDYAGQDGNVFRRTRCRDNICTSQEGRGAPSSNALMWAGKPGATAIRLESSAYFHACNPGNIVWPVESFAVHDVTETDFVPRAPLALTMCWE